MSARHWVRDYLQKYPYRVRVLYKVFGITLMLGGFVLSVAVNVDPSSDHEDRVVAGVFGGTFMSAGVALLIMARRLPIREIMRMAEAKKGLLTLSEIVTAIDVDPERALRALKKLQKVGIATQRWQEIHKNVWEFPDYMQLPIQETLDLAQKRGGKVSLKDLVASGHSIDVAQQTLDTLAEKGLGQQDPGTGERALIMERQ